MSSIPSLGMLFAKKKIDIFGEIAGICFSPGTKSLFFGVADRTYGSGSGSLLEFEPQALLGLHLVECKSANIYF